MKGMKKIYHGYAALFLPLAAILLGILIMGLQRPITTQSAMAIPMPQSFLGEYSYDGAIWHPLEDETDLSASYEDLYLRGHFAHEIPGECRLYFFCNHIGSEFFVNGQLLEQDVILEIEQYGLDLQPSMCSREWKFCYFEEYVPTDSLVEIHLKNPHKFGNRNAYNDFMKTLCCTPNEQIILEKYYTASAQPYNVLGAVIGIAGILLLCTAVVSLFLRYPVDIAVVQTGLLGAFVGGVYLLDTIDLSFRIESHIVTTCGWQLCVMYSVYLLGLMLRDTLDGKWKRVAGWVMWITAVADMAVILLSFIGVVLIYDTLRFWVILQWICCPVLIICCLAQLFSGNKKGLADLILLPVIFVCVLLDCMGVMSSIYSRGVMTKTAVVIFFLLKLFQFVRSIITNFKASSRAHKLEEELEESRIAIMISQIQPHFIFNVLGTIRGLCREDPEQAWRGLGDFSSYLRANMNALTNASSIPFEMELAHVETYLRLEQMRMGEKLNVIYDIQEKAFTIPPLMLQPLVENAVKHGIFYKADGGTIIIRSIREKNRIVLTVQDDGIGFEAASQEADFTQRDHHGLANVRSRVEKILGGSLMIDSHPECGSTVTLEFPDGDHS